MKVLDVDSFELRACLKNAHGEGVVITQKGKPIAYIVEVRGMDLEQVELGQSDELWQLIQERRKEKPISREELEKGLPTLKKKKSTRVSPKSRRAV